VEKYATLKLRKKEKSHAEAIRLLENPELENAFKFCEKCQKKVKVEGHQCFQVGWFQKKRKRSVPGKEGVVVSQDREGAMQLKKTFLPDAEQLQKELTEMTAANEQLRKRLALQPDATVVPAPVRVQTQGGHGSWRNNFNRNKFGNPNTNPTSNVPPPPGVSNVGTPQNVGQNFRYRTQ